MRSLLVLDGLIEAGVLRERLSSQVTTGHELAICYVAGAPSGLARTLNSQRALTALLREVLGDSAENVAIFVVSGADGDGVDECAAEWGATNVMR